MKDKVLVHFHTPEGVSTKVVHEGARRVKAKDAQVSEPVPSGAGGEDFDAECTVVRIGLGPGDIL